MSREIGVVLAAKKIVRLEIDFNRFLTSDWLVAFVVVVVLHCATHKMIVAGECVGTVEMKPHVGIVLVVQHSDSVIVDFFFSAFERDVVCGDESRRQ